MSNEGKIKASIFLILLKCIVVEYSNGNESFAGRLFSNYGPLNMLIPSFSISNLNYFSRGFCQKFYEENFLFKLKLQKSMSICSILQKMRMSNFVWFVILKWSPFEFKVKSWKICPFLEMFFSEIKNADVSNFSWIKYVGNDFSFLEKGHIWVYYCWNYGPLNLKAELKADFWLQIGVYSRKNCPRHGSGWLPPANSYWSGDVVLMFLMLFLKSIDIFS